MPLRRVLFTEQRAIPRFVVQDFYSRLYLCAFLTPENREAHCIRAGFRPDEIDPEAQETAA